ncbi:Hypothetical predicted protein [Octopus vulgaris]|uniref:Uncharacterized protein n=1 Tax=Octopus vulgaris TaxID=6645 RepID=A0AA36BXP3_OCTVU|nr:Hypothetical predicted protein [Octopus vulgaris]
MKLLDKKQRLSTVPDIKDPSIPQIPTVQHAISGHTMQKDSPFHSGRKQDFDNEYGGHTLRPLQRILVSHPLSNTSFPNLTNTFQFSLKLLPYMYSIKKAILWLYLRPVQTAEEEEFTVLDVNCLSTNKSLRTRKVKLERNSEGKGKWNTFETTKLINIYIYMIYIYIGVGQ